MKKRLRKSQRINTCACVFSPRAKALNMLLKLSSATRPRLSVNPCIYK